MSFFFFKQKWLSYYADQRFFPSYSADMLESNNLVTFEGLANSSAYHTFLLDEEKGRLVVGAKDHIFSFNLLNVSRDYAQVKPLSDFSGWWFLPSIVTRRLLFFFALLTNLISALSVHLHPEGQSGAQVSRDFLFCFYRKVPHEFFRPGLSHTITRCARHVSCSLHTWMNNGVNWNKVDNKSHCDPHNPQIYTCVHSSCSCINSTLKKLIPGGVDALLTLCLCCRSPGRLLPPEETNASGREKISR